MSDLRTRIAAAIYEASDKYTRKLMVNPRLPGCADVEGDSKPVCFVLADAVIRELGLEPQAHYDPDCEFYRYVTDWIDPQTNQRVDLP